MTNAPRAAAYDLFVSHCPADRPWVMEMLVPALEAAGLRVCLPDRDFAIGVPRVINIEQAVDGSRHTIIVMTPEWLASEWGEFESLLIATADPAGRQRRLIPLLLKPCALPARIAILTAADFIEPARRTEELTRLLQAIGRRARVFVSYKRNTLPDEPLALRLGAALEQAGHTLFVDHKLTVGVDWAAEIHRQIEAADFLIVLLSAASVHSEMVTEEVEHAARLYTTRGKARLIPVRVAFGDALPYPLSQALDEIHYAEWATEADDARLFRQVSDAISAFAALPPAPIAPLAPLAVVAAPLPAADPRFIESLREPGGAVRADSVFYIERPEDELLRRELAKSHGTTTTIRAARQTGKSSMLINSIAHAKQHGSRVVFLDLQPVDPQILQSLDDFLRYFLTVIVSKLHLETTEVEKAWGSKLGAPDKATYLMEDYILPAMAGSLVLALDEVDRLLQAPFHDSFFGLLRFWHNNRAIETLWEKLDIVLVISTEPHLFITDVTQSPFNVGQKLRLRDFDLAQVSELNRRYRSPLTEAEVADAMAYLGGHPYLTHKAIYTVVSQQMSWSDLRKSAAGEQSPFGDHLRRYLWLLREQGPLRDALRRIIQQRICPEEVTFYRLLQAGLIQGADRSECRCRCQLYEEYLRDKV